MNNPKIMRCIEISKHGGPEVLKSTIRPVPKIIGNEVLIKVRAAGVNRPDCLQRQGLYPPPAGQTDLLGLEVSGTIIKTAKVADQFNVGTEVTALVSGGGYSG